ncbi:MAG TPA: hypothetical protein VGP95_17110 [Gemmatimonadaceae bacterium]|jgi:hypothetical protein|nr:hypothetical protein [Gemmatimonadaceae bacterium]
MERQVAYCSACDKDVSIVTTDEPSQDGHANLHDAEIVCLEIGDACTGSLCPIGATSPTVMAARLVRNGLQTIMQPAFQATCVTCGRTTTHVIVERAHAICEECGTTKPRSALVVEM